MTMNRKLFLSGFIEESPLIMHCVSQVVDRQFLLGDEEREVFVEMMRMYEEFCGIKVLSYCVMSNHFHILLEIPPRIHAVDLSDEEFLAKLSSIYSVAYVKEVKSWMQKLNKNQATKAMRELKAKYTYRMGNMSEFMKSLKQRFSRWYNKTHGRRGTLWEERYSSTAVSAGSAAKMVAAYIDLNPLRASKRRKKRSGYSREEVDQILEKNGKLSRSELLRCKTRYFTDGAVIGSKSFVNGLFKRVKDGLAGDRQVGAKPMRKVQKIDVAETGEGSQLYSAWLKTLKPQSLKG